MELALPSKLFTDKVEVALRGGLYPLSMRAEVLGNRDVCEYWRRCTAAREHVHSVQIMGSDQDVDREWHVDLSQFICIDISALLSLWTLGIADEICDAFPFFIVAGSLRAALDEASFSGGETSLATQLRQWIRSKGAHVRIRHHEGAKAARASEHQGYVKRSGVFQRPASTPLAGRLLFGTGESALLAESLRCPLYCDDAVTRLSAESEMSVQTISTLGLLRQLRKAGRLTMVVETECLARLLRQNFRYVGVQPENFHWAVKAWSLMSGTEKGAPSPRWTPKSGH